MPCFRKFEDVIIIPIYLHMTGPITDQAAIRVADYAELENDAIIFPMTIHG